MTRKKKKILRHSFNKSQTSKHTFGKSWLYWLIDRCITPRLTRHSENSRRKEKLKRNGWWGLKKKSFATRHVFSEKVITINIVRQSSGLHAPPEVFLGCRYLFEEIIRKNKNGSIQFTSLLKQYVSQSFSQIKHAS